MEKDARTYRKVNSFFKHPRTLHLLATSPEEDPKNTLIDIAEA
jgi:hypothetical protein